MDDPKYPRVGSPTVLSKNLKADSATTRATGTINMHRPWIDNLVCQPDDPTGKSHIRGFSDVLDCSSPFHVARAVHHPFENKESSILGRPSSNAIGQTRGWFYLLHVMVAAPA